MLYCILSSTFMPFLITIIIFRMKSTLSSSTNFLLGQPAPASEWPASRALADLYNHPVNAPSFKIVLLEETKIIKEAF